MTGPTIAVAWACMAAGAAAVAAAGLRCILAARALDHRQDR